MEFDTVATETAWYSRWFGTPEYEVVYKSRSREDAERLVALVEQLARPGDDDSILDVACGRGRHARVFARRGYSVTGLDLSGAVLTDAKRKSEAEGLDIRFIRQDMRQPVCSNCFDGAVNLFTAFGYFETEDDDLEALDAVSVALRPDGWFVQDFLNADYVERNLQPDDVRTIDGLEVQQHRRITDGRVEKEIVLRRNGTERTFTESVRLYRLSDFERLYERAGLRLVDVRGDYDGRPYHQDSPRLILHARKE